jgi:hypothetical protein
MILQAISLALKLLPAMATVYFPLFCIASKRLITTCLHNIIIKKRNKEIREKKKDA